MKTLKMYVYDQNYSGAYFYETLGVYKEDLSIIPLKCNFYNSKDVNYKDIGVVDISIVPDMVYFNGVYNGDDCPCCGDRWYRLEENDLKIIYIFETVEEYKNSNIGKCDYYFILEDLKELDNGYKQHN